MNAYVIWYRTRPSDELCRCLESTLQSVDAVIPTQNTTIHAEQLPAMLAKGLRTASIVVIVGGMEQLREEDNIMFILSRCLSLQLEIGSLSRSRFIYDTLRGTRLPSFESAVLFPYKDDSLPEGVVVTAGNQTIILLPWLERHQFEMLETIGYYLPQIIGYEPPERLVPPAEAEPEQTIDPMLQPGVKGYIERISKKRKGEVIVKDEELSPGELRYWFSTRMAKELPEETNTIETEAAVKDAGTPRVGFETSSESDIPDDEPEFSRFTPHENREQRRANFTIGGVSLAPLAPLLRAVSAVLVVVVVVGICIAGFGSYESGVIQPKTVYQDELSRLYSSNGESTQLPSGFPEGALPKFAELYRINPTVAGYLSIPGTDLSQPIVTADPQQPTFNASLDFYGKNDARGTLYFAPGTEIALGVNNPNLVVYGNNNGDGSMFGELNRYTNAEYLSQHQLITMDTLFDSSQWVVFSVCYVSGDTIDEFNYADTSFAGLYAHQIHLYNLYIRSMFYTATEVFPDEQVLTLITDSDAFAGAKLLVCARKVREEEDLSYVGSNIVANEEVLMPDLWYKVNHVDTRPTIPPIDLPTEPTTTYTTTTADPNAPTTTTTTRATTTTTTAQTTTAAVSQQTDETTGTTEPTTAATQPDVPVSGSDQTTTAEEAATKTTTAPTTMAASTSVPNMKITSGGKVISGPASEVLAKIVEAEIGSSRNIEALKAQAVAAYTFYLYSGGSAKAPYFPTKTPGKLAKQAAEAVAGQYMTANGTTPYTPYYATSAGKTADNRDINGADLDYLVSVDCSVDESVSGFRTVKEMSAAEVAKKVKAKKGIDLTSISNKSSWFEVLERDRNDLYVKQVKVGNKTFKGNTLHLSILGYTCLRSPAFWIEYDSSRDVFVFTSLGYGTGVGMSQTGADKYAGLGKNYVWILQHFYTGVKIKSK